jgi:cephalosporin hydroxylase
VDSYVEGVDNRHLYDEWTPDDAALHVVEGDSRDPAVRNQVEALSPEFDWVFIDAGHYYAEVKSDWETFGPLASEGGVVVLHDILPPTQAHPEIEVAFLWNEIKQTHSTLEIVDNRAAEWGGLGVVLI